MKTQLVYGVLMTSLENMMFSKWMNNNNVAMNTHTEAERTEIAQAWLNSHFKKGTENCFKG